MRRQRLERVALDELGPVGEACLLDVRAATPRPSPGRARARARGRRDTALRPRARSSNTRASRRSRAPRSRSAAPRSANRNWPVVRATWRPRCSRGTFRARSSASSASRRASTARTRSSSTRPSLCPKHLHARPRTRVPTRPPAMAASLPAAGARLCDRTVSNLCRSAQRRDGRPRTLGGGARRAGRKVVVHDAARLHRGVDRSRPDEAEARPSQLLRQRGRLGSR